VFLSFLGRLVMQEWDAGLPTQFGIAVLGWAVCVAVSALQAWYDGKGKAGPRPGSPLAPPAAPDSRSA
jgi:hypothetical protein